MLKIGVDVGITGAFAFIEDDKCLCVIDMPVMPQTMKRKQVNAAEIARLLEFWRSKRDGNIIAYVESQAAMPTDGRVGLSSFFTGYGIIQGVLATLGIPYRLVAPQVWKRRAGLIKKEKDYARAVAQKLFPNVSLARKKDCGRADSLLIAKFGEGD